MSNFGSFSYFQTFLSLGVEQGLQKLPKFDINDLRLLFHCNILIPRKCPRKTLFKAPCNAGADSLPPHSIAINWVIVNDPWLHPTITRTQVMMIRADKEVASDFPNKCLCVAYFLFEKPRKICIRCVEKSK